MGGRRNAYNIIGWKPHQFHKCILQMNIDGAELEFECQSNLASHLIETKINGKEVTLQVTGHA